MLQLGDEGKHLPATAEPTREATIATIAKEARMLFKEKSIVVVGCVGRVRCSGFLRDRS